MFRFISNAIKAGKGDGNAADELGSQLVNATLAAAQREHDAKKAKGQRERQRLATLKQRERMAAQQLKAVSRITGGRRPAVSARDQERQQKVAAIRAKKAAREALGLAEQQKARLITLHVDRHITLNERNELQAELRRTPTKAKKGSISSPSHTKSSLKARIKALKQRRAAIKKEIAFIIKKFKKEDRLQFITDASTAAEKQITELQREADLKTQNQAAVRAAAKSTGKSTEAEKHALLIQSSIFRADSTIEGQILKDIRILTRGYRGRDTALDPIQRLITDAKLKFLSAMSRIVTGQQTFVDQDSYARKQTYGQASATVQVNYDTQALLEQMQAIDTVEPFNMKDITMILKLTAKQEKVFQFGHKNFTESEVKLAKHGKSFVKVYEMVRTYVGNQIKQTVHTP